MEKHFESEAFALKLYLFWKAVSGVKPYFYLPSAITVLTVLAIF